MRVVVVPAHGHAILLLCTDPVKVCFGPRAMYRLDVESQSQPTSIDVIASALEPGMVDVGRLSSPDGALTLLLSDIADAGALAERLGAEGWEQLLRDHHTLVEYVIAHHDGELVKFERDGFFASFSSAHAGLRAAVELQRTFTADPAAADGAAVALRIGLHSGFVIADPEQPLGRNVVLASRIAARAQGGEILVSSTLKQFTETDPSFEFESRGEHHFKGVLGEHAVYAARLR
jgi:class 3 adenylate cyclase